MRTRLFTACRRPEGDGGFATIELIVITPFLLAFVLLVVGFGRVTHGRQLVDQAAAAAARAAALSNTPGQAQVHAQNEAAATLSQAGVSCQSIRTTVDTSSFHAGGTVAVTVTCVASLADLTVVGFPGHRTLTATSVSPLEQYRQFGEGTR
ncbi:TadE family protein [Jatrophihabitans sp. YIM 134969]